MAQYDLRLVVYEGDEFLDVLPQPAKISAAFPMNDTPALQFSYSGVDDIRGAELLNRLINEQLDVALEINWGNGWIEPRGGRFIVTNEEDDTADPARMYNFHTDPGEVAHAGRGDTAAPARTYSLTVAAEGYEPGGAP